MPTIVNPSKSTLQNLLTAILSIANQDQNFGISPIVYTSMFNTITSFIINEAVRLYPSNSQVVDLIDPFVKIARCTPANGFIPLPDDYRNLLGSPSINVKGDGAGECSDAPPINTIQQFQVSVLKGGCLRRPITIVSQSEFDVLTTSTYKKPDYNNPIAYFAGNRKLKVCPFDVSAVDLLYVFKEPAFNFGYQMNPDDTYNFDPNTSVESTWGSDCFEHLLKGLTHLYAAYSRDKTFTDFARLLSEISIVQ